jgi:hypothetical protein
MKAWLLFMASAVFLLCINQRAFAGCTDELDGNGTFCQASSNCGKGCGDNFTSGGGVIQSHLSAPLLGNAQLSASAIPVTRTSQIRPRSISLTSLSLLALLFSSVILYRRQLDKWAGISGNRRGRA